MTVAAAIAEERLPPGPRGSVVQMLRYAREKYGPDATPQDAYVDFVMLAAPVRARRWRVRVTAARGAVRIAEFGLYRSRV